MSNPCPPSQRSTSSDPHTGHILCIPFPPNNIVWRIDFIVLLVIPLSSQLAEARREIAKTCTQCGSSMNPSMVPNFGDSQQHYALAIFDMPCLSCPQGHQRAFAYSGFPADMLVEIFARLLKIVVRGIVGRHRFCCRCQKPMSEAMPEDGTLVLQISLKGHDAFRVELAGLLWRCAHCQQKQVLKDRDLTFEIPEALMKGFDSVGIKN